MAWLIFILLKKILVGSWKKYNTHVMEFPTFMFEWNASYIEYALTTLIFDVGFVLVDS